MKKKWQIRAYDETYSTDIQKQYHCEKIIADILAVRHITEAEEVQFFLENNIHNCHNPFLFDEINQALHYIFKAVKKKKKVMVYGDRDVDGIASTVLMVQTLSSLNLDVDWQLPQGDSPYGFTSDIIKEFAKKGGQLFISVDCGSTSVEEIKTAVKFGLDVIIIDHHELQETLPPAQAIVNPKMSDSSYPFPYLCACAVVAKCVWAIRFAQTDLYQKPLCLCTARIGNNTILIDVIRMVNFVEEERVSEALVPHVDAYATSRLPRIFKDAHIYIYDKVLFEKLFPDIVREKEDNITDLAPKIQEIFPFLAGKSLLEIKDQSHAKRYKSVFEEIDVLYLLFMRYLEREYSNIYESFSQSLELVALATIADMMPLRNENRVFVHHGLEKLNTNIHPGLLCLLEKSKRIKENYDIYDIGWHITPLLNATGRMGKPDLAVHLLLPDTPEEKRHELAQEIVLLNQERRQICDSAWKTLVHKGQKNLQDMDNKFVWLYGSNNVPRGIVGLLAARFATYFNAPALVFSRSCEGKHISGSIRTGGIFDATAFLHNFQHIFTGWGGHAAAAGFYFDAEKKDVFIKELMKQKDKLKTHQVEVATIDIDIDLPVTSLSKDLYEQLQKLAPFGNGNPFVVFLLRKIKVEKIFFLGASEKHLKLFFLCGNTRWQGIYWNASEFLGRDFAENDYVNIVFYLEKNEYRASRVIRFHVLDMRRVLDE